jgi:Zn-dependent protease
MIAGHMTRSQNGKISAAGPAMNLLVALFFLPLAFTSGIWQAVGMYGFRINAWLGLFNLIPFAMFDGAKIWAWSKAAYFGLAAVALGLIVVQNLMVMGMV